MGNRHPQRYERRGPDHDKCEGTSFGPCACNCHYEWMPDIDLVRLRDGAVGVVCGVLLEPEYMMVVHLGFRIRRAVEIGEAVLLDQQGDES